MWQNEFTCDLKLEFGVLRDESRAKLQRESVALGPLADEGPDVSIRGQLRTVLAQQILALPMPALFVDDVLVRSEGNRVEHS